MKLLQDRILTDGRYLGGGILKVDSFMNHQIDANLMGEIGKEFAKIFSNLSPTKILTAESSGIAPALSYGMLIGIPVIFARKHQPVTMPAQPLRQSTVSHTHGGKVELLVSPEYLPEGDSVLIIDDFLASAKTIMALAGVVNQSGAKLIGIGCVIEKSFEGGRQVLAPLGVPVKSLVNISEFQDDRIIFGD